MAIVAFIATGTNLSEGYRYMSKKNKGQQNAIAVEKKSAADYYHLKTDAVEKLVNAKDAPEVSDAEIRKYTSKGKLNIPPVVKVLFVKFWFSGAVCYFFLWGLRMLMRDTLDMMLVTAIGLGVVTDLMVNHVLRAMEPYDRAYDKYIMVTWRKNWSIFINVLYSGVVLFFVYKTYEVINMVFVGAESNITAVGVEPLLFGLLYMGFDMLLIAMKNMFMKIVKEAETKVSGKNNK